MTCNLDMPSCRLH